MELLLQAHHRFLMIQPAATNVQLWATRMCAACSVFKDPPTQRISAMLRSPMPEEFKDITVCCFPRNGAAKGVTFNTNYTWSHCIGPYVMLYDASALWPYETYTNPNNRDADRGNCDSDRRHIFNLTSVAETPQFSNRTMRLVATGWRLSGI